MIRVHYLQHVPFEGIGCIADWAATRGCSVTGTRLFAGEVLPTVASFDWLLIMGGPMSVHDEAEYRWLAREKRFVRRALQAGRTAIGVCLGAQLIAEALGAPVTRNPVKEIGWFPVGKHPRADSLRLLRDMPRELVPLHWHGETFGLPEGAVPLFRSAACENQGFLYDGRVLALQFHLEIEPRGLKALIANCPGDLKTGPFVQAPADMLAVNPRFERANDVSCALLDRLAGR